MCDPRCCIRTCPINPVAHKCLNMILMQPSRTMPRKFSQTSPCRSVLRLHLFDFYSFRNPFYWLGNWCYQPHWGNLQVQSTHSNRALGAVKCRLRKWKVIHAAARTELNGRTLDDYAVNAVGTRNLISTMEATEAAHQGPGPQQRCGDSRIHRDAGAVAAG